MELSAYEQKTLDTLEGKGGYLTRDIAARVKPQFGQNKRAHSAAVRGWLRSLEKRGLVSRLDNELPVVWVAKSTSSGN